MRNRANSESIPRYSDQASLGIRSVVTRLEDVKKVRTKEKQYLLDVLNSTPPPSPLLGTRKFIIPSPSSNTTNTPAKLKSNKFFFSLTSSIRSNSKRRKPISFIMESSNPLPLLAIPVQDKEVLVPRVEIGNLKNDINRNEGLKDLMAFLRGEDEIKSTSCSSSITMDSFSTENTKNSSPISRGSKKSPTRVPVPFDYLLPSDLLEEVEATTPSSLAFLLDTGEYDESPAFSSSYTPRSDSLPSSPYLLPSSFTSINSSSISLAAKRLPPTPLQIDKFNFSQKGKACSITSSSNDSFHSISGLSSPSTLFSTPPSRRMDSSSTPPTPPLLDQIYTPSSQRRDNISLLFDQLHSLIQETSKEEGIKLIKRLGGKEVNSVEIEILESIGMLRNLQKDVNSSIDVFIDRLIEDGKRFDD